MLVKTLVLLSLIVAASAGELAAPTPVVIWHGMGDSCCNPFSMGRMVDMIEDAIPGVYVKSLEIGSNMLEDMWNSFFMNVNDQVDFVCKTLKQDSQLQRGFHAVGFSQGSQFLRAYVERCNDPPVLNLISIGGQHQGVYGLPDCPGPNYTLCELARELLDYGAYIPWIQSFQVQAEYWHDPFNEDLYLNANIFLPDINNAGPSKNPTYRFRMTTLKNFVMVKFEHDTVVQPRESEWFEFYYPGQDVAIQPLRESPLYQGDWIGLKSLDKSGRLHFISTPGNHLQFSDSWFLDTIINPWLKFNSTQIYV